MNLWLPIPYAKHCKITYGEEAAKDPKKAPDWRWYNIEYRTYATGTPVQSFTMADLQARKADVQRACEALLNPPAPPQGKSAALDQLIKSGEEASLDLPGGPAAIRQLELKLSTDQRDQLEQALRSTIIRIQFDGAETVWCPASDFFGSGIGVNVLQSWYRSVAKDGTMTCRWVMPYAKSARITLLNIGKTAVTARLGATVGDWSWDARSMHFHSNWRCQYGLPTRPMSDWNYLAAAGRGVYLGDALCVFNPVTDWWGEGDEKIYVDDSAFPTHFGTGTEDYYCYSWGNTTLFQGPFANQVRVDGPGNAGHTVVTRTRSLDAIPFSKSLKVDMEIWHWKDCKVGYAVASYWYALPGATCNRAPQPQEAAAPIPTMPNRRTKIPGAIECETMAIVAQSPGIKIETQDVDALPNGAWSGGKQLFVRANKVGDFVELRFPVADAGPRRVLLHLTKSWDYGILRFTVNGKPAGKDYDAFSAEAVSAGPVDLEVFEPQNGEMVLRVEVVGANAASRGTKSFFGLDCVVLSPAEK